MSEHHEPATIDAAHADPRAPSVFFIGAVSVVLLVVLLVGLEVLHVRALEREYQRKVVVQQPQELRQARTEQLEQIHTYRWIDQQNGVVAIPIDRAMELIVDESRPGAGTRP